MKSIRFLLASSAMVLLLAGSSHASFLIQVDTDGLDDAILTYSPNFGFGGDSTSASQSSKSNAVGLTGGDSVFSADGDRFNDTYVYTYDLDVDGDNQVFAPGTPLNDDGNFASGQLAGVSDDYSVYATWPATNNVSGGLTTFTLTDDLSNTLFSVQIDQNTAQGFVNPTDNLTYSGHEWIFLSNAALDANRTYTLTQVAGSNSFVSMRSAGILFDVAVPEPASVALFGLAGLCLAGIRRR